MTKDTTSESLEDERDSEWYRSYDKDYDEILDKADELQSDYYEKKKKEDNPNLLPNYSMSTWITGISKGEVIDMRIDEEGDIIKVDVRIEDDVVETAEIRDRNTEYTDRNELVRLLEYLDINEGRVEKILGKEIPVYIDRYSLPSNDWESTQWRPYIPRKLSTTSKIKHKTDKFMRYLGYEGEFQGRIMAISFLIVSLFWWFLLFGILTTSVVAFQSLSASFSLIFVIVSILSVIMTIYTPLISRIGRIGWEKLVERRYKNNVLDE